MFKGRNTTRMLVTMALLSAIEVVLARFIVPMPNPTMRFSIEAVPIIVAGYLYGPVAGAIVGLVGDAVGTLFSGYGYNPVFAVSPVAIGLCAGLLRALVIRKASYPRILASFLPDRAYAWLMRYERFGFILVILLVSAGAASQYLNVAISTLFRLFCRVVGFEV